MHYGRNRTLDAGKISRHKSPRKRRNALNMAFLTKKSNIFIKAKLIASKMKIFLSDMFLGSVANSLEQSLSRLTKVNKQTRNYQILGKHIQSN